MIELFEGERNSIPLQLLVLSISDSERIVNDLLSKIARLQY